MHAYNAVIEAAIAQRLRTVATAGSVLYVAFNGLDWVVYPQQASRFLGWRVAIAAFLALIAAVCTRPTLQRWSAWLGDLTVLVAAAGIACMIGATDQSAGDYHQGLTLCILAMFTVNSFSLAHNLGSGAAMLAMYTIAVWQQATTHGPRLISAYFFMSATMVFTAILTRVFSVYHRLQYQQARALEATNLDLHHPMAEREAMQEQLRNLSMTDDLTGLHNRRGFKLLVDEQRKLARRNKSGLLLFFGDIDGLKAINDNHGHAQGDLAIQKVAALLKQSCRDTDILARLGGDEFTVLAVGAAAKDADSFTRRLRGSLDTFNQQSGLPFRLAVSIGATYIDAADSATIDELMQRADDELYALKRQKKQARQSTVLVGSILGA